MFSVIVPAHNEEQVIARCLRALTEGASPGELEVIVVCNACTDGTADVVRRFGGAVRLIETETPGKSNALNLGDASAQGFPRFYVDADVVVSVESLRHMERALRRDGVFAASPRVRWDLDGASWAVRAFYDIDRRLPSHLQTIGGSGVYAVSEQGHLRLGSFPPLTADDAYVRNSFAVHERQTVNEASSLVTPPKTLSGVVSIKTRSHFGNYELARLYPKLSRNVGASNGPALLRLATRPWLWPKLSVYGYVKVRAKLAARRRVRSGGQLEWIRDDTSRSMGPGGQAPPAGGAAVETTAD
jgi:glycosyltransferase involved in cell wall biosynthesis